MPPTSSRLHVLSSLHLWDEASDRERDWIARSVQAHLIRSGLPPLEYVGLRTWSLAHMEHRVAEFELEDARFSLVPGGVGRLGWDGSRLQLSLRQRSQWRAQLVREGEVLPPSEQPEEVLAPRLRPPRHRLLKPFLVETKARPAHLYTSDAGDESELLLALHDGVARSGFLLPTADQWEWANRAGTSTFFRWGEQWPEIVPNHPYRTFHLHEQPNALGLEFGFDTYSVECVAELDGFVGGDGGAALGQPRPALESWCPLAPAFFFPLRDVEDALTAFFDAAGVRRVLDLGAFADASEASRPVTPLPEPTRHATDAADKPTSDTPLGQN